MNTTKMKTWENFIEFAIPEKSEREDFRGWVKNALLGIKNEKMLILYGEGPTGKTTTINVLYKIIENSIIVDGVDKRTLSYIYDKSVVFVDDGGNTGYIEAMHAGEQLPVCLPYVKTFYPSTWPDIVFVTNELLTGMRSMGLVINMPNRPDEMDAHLIEKLCEDLESVRNWFLE